MIFTDVYGRLCLTVPNETTRAEVALPGGGLQGALPFTHQDAHFSYDRHGYESAALVGEPCRQVSFTACAPGKHRLRAYSGDRMLAETEFEALPSGRPGFVEVSKKDPRYFALSDGAPYVPIGLNLVGCDYDRLPAGMEHFEASQDTATTGMLQWRRWFAQMRENGVNYCRVWLSNRYTEARTELMGVHDPVALARFEALIELARESGVRLKLCLEHWRTFKNVGHFAYRRYVDPDTGLQLRDENEWFTSPKWNELWLKDIEPYIARCQNDPVVFAWELWNEIDCGSAGFEQVAGFTGRMLEKVKEMSPHNLAVNSLGSFDEEWKQERQDRFRDMPQMDFQQVHRYLDQGAPMAICHADPVEFSIEAVKRSRRLDKPVILTETGAVNDRHVGPFRFYGCDHDGLIFCDVTYPALFAGAAGSGHIWHWNEYVEPKNLWKHFRPLAEAVANIAFDEEDFAADVLPREQAWVLLLRGKKHTLALVRNKADRWDAVLRDGKRPEAVNGLRLKLSAASVKAYWLLGEDCGHAAIEGGEIALPAFVHGCVLRIKNKEAMA